MLRLVRHFAARKASAGLLAAALLLGAGSGLAQSAASMASATPPLRFLVSEAWAMPFGEIRRSGGHTELVQGIMKEWQDQLAAALGRRAVIVFASRRREEGVVRDQGTDLRCLMSPEWIPTEDQSRYDWPESFLRIEQRLVGPAERQRIHSVEQLKGSIIGTVGGYLYPLLDEWFARGWMRRDDAPTEPTALAKQLSGRVDYTVMREIDLRYQQRQRPEVATLAISPLVVSSTPVYCARERGSEVSLDDINRAQRELLKRGRLAEILKRYLD
jgi:polar amino acid transport system substrate-binding protein